MPATLTAIADPEEPRQPNTGIVTIADIMEVYELVRAKHPDWFIDDQGWESVQLDEAPSQN